MNIEPGYGSTVTNTSIRDAWNQDLNADSRINSGTSDDGVNYSMRLNVDIRYGISHDYGLFSPYSGMTLSDDADRYRLGVSWEGNRFGLELVAEQEKYPSYKDDAILLIGEIKF